MDTTSHYPLSPSSLPRVGMPSPLPTFPRVGIGLAVVFATWQTALPHPLPTPLLTPLHVYITCL
ncbi:hypothetical protein HanRHA438_Chr10g0465021 [Helianthus annuus]|nr:hypothetical protein HanRHA438_Chr10g0465021 [Helianthus annuus]